MKPNDADANRLRGDDKQEVYATLKIRLNSALRSEFWFEACMIEYAIIEDRTSSILDKARVCKDAYSSDRPLKNKLNSIENQIGKKHPIISKKVSGETVSALKSWRERRNDIVHRACNKPYNDSQLKDFALEGKELVRTISNDSQKVTRLAKKLYGEHS